MRRKLKELLVVKNFFATTEIYVCKCHSKLLIIARDLIINEIFSTSTNILIFSGSIYDRRHMPCECLYISVDVIG